MLDRLIAASLAMLACAVAIYAAIRLVESVAATLLIIVAVIGGLIIAGFLLRLLWHRNRANRW